MRLGRGAVVVVELNRTLGREQHGVRPCVVVSDPDIISDQRFPLVCVVPVTGTPGQGLLYPALLPGLKRPREEPSFALIDHLRSVDKRRIRRVLGELPRKKSLPSTTGSRCSSAWAAGRTGMAYQFSEGGFCAPWSRA